MKDELIYMNADETQQLWRIYHSGGKNAQLALSLLAVSSIETDRKQARLLLHTERVQELAGRMAK